MESLRFADLFAGLGGFHVALASLGHRCVFASEIDPVLRETYLKNFPGIQGRLFGDIRADWDKIDEPFEILCAGFPCQPFSKSGGQEGTKDETRGTLFHEIVKVLRKWRPEFVILENVGNFERHDRGNTWRVVKSRLENLGYNVRGTEHVSPLPKTDWRDRNGGPRRRRFRVPSIPSRLGIGLISPHHFGHPHHRGRFFIVASTRSLAENPFPKPDKTHETSLSKVVQPASQLSEIDLKETALRPQQVNCINHWNELLAALPKSTPIPSFPIWGDELDARYPFESSTPWATPPTELAQRIPGEVFPPYTRKRVLLQHLPSYAREEVERFRPWKVHYIRSNRKWWGTVRRDIPRGWVVRLKNFPPSMRKLEWNVNHESGRRDLWRYVLQFRPSGLRAKRYTSSPALVAMTATQIPLLGPEKRFLTRVEGLRLQGFGDGFALPESREQAFQALGNAVHVDVARRIAANLLKPGRVYSQQRLSIPVTA